MVFLLVGLTVGDAKHYTSGWQAMRHLRALCLTGACLAGACAPAEPDPVMRRVVQPDACGFEVDLGNGNDFRRRVQALLLAASRQAEALSSSVVTGAVSGPATTDLARHWEIARFGEGIARTLSIRDVVIGVQPLDPKLHASYRMGVSVCGRDLFERIASQGPSRPQALERFQAGDVVLSIPVIYSEPSAGWIAPRAGVSRIVPAIRLDRQTRRPFADLDECRGSPLAADCADRLLLVHVATDRLMADRQPTERQYGRNLRLEPGHGAFQANCIRSDAADGDQRLSRCLVRSRSLPGVLVLVMASGKPLRQSEVAHALEDVAHLIIGFAQDSAAAN